MAPTRTGPRLIVAMVGMLLVSLATSACGLPRVLSAKLPDSQGTVSVGKSLSQPFYSPSNGLDGVTIAIAPPVGSGDELLPDPTGGATLAVRYAPEADNRFPDNDFHAWPAQHEWLGELTGDRQIGQSFLSRYPGLNGITVRVATFGADTGTGEARLKTGAPVPVLALPVDGKLVTSLPGGSAVTVAGAAEGWAHVQVSDVLDGYVALDLFAQLPAAQRQNTHDVVLTLYRESDMMQIRRATINAAQLHDNSHVTFRFDPISNSDGQRYRFDVTSPDSTPGNAVTFRVDPQSSYGDGQRFEGDRVVDGALIFRPDYAPGEPLYQRDVDDLEWSSLSSAFVAGFSPQEATAGRYLKVDLTPGSRTLNVKWSLLRPSGGLPLVIDGNSQSPGGGLVFNVRYRDNVSLSGLVRDAGGAVGHDVRSDPTFFAVYLLIAVCLLTIGAWAGARRMLHGR